jgi:hypothetical protein
VVSLPDNQTRILPRNAAGILDGCRSFQPVENHAEHALAMLKLSEADRPALASLFRDFQSSGLLVSEKALLAAVAAEATKAVPRIVRLAVTTADRPGILKRCLDGFGAAARRCGRAMTFTVFDDSSRDEEAQSARAVAGAVARPGWEARYAGRAEREAFVRRMARAGLRPESLEFALFDAEHAGLAIGCNRNVFLLDTAGEISGCVDDDVVCQLFRSPASAPGLRPFSGYNPARVLRFPDCQSALDSAVASEQDLWSAHEQLLGRPPRQGLRQGLVEDDAEFSHELFESLITGAGNVLVTFSGLAGDSGSATNAGWLTVTGGVRESLVESPERYRSLLRSRSVLMVSESLTVTDSTHCMAYAFAIDCRELTPPFFPVRRNEDGVFGAVLARIYPAGSSGFIPLAVRHDPPGDRAFSPDDVWRDAAKFGIGELARYMIQIFHPGPHRDVASRMRALGHHLQEIGRLPQPEFDALARERFLESAGWRLAKVEDALEYWRGEPEFWARDCERFREVILRSVRQPTVVPCDLTGGRTDEGARALARRLILRYGELLVDWPDIFAAARQSGASVERLSRAVGGRG